MSDYDYLGPDPNDPESGEAWGPIPPEHGEPASPGVMPRCPHCGTVIDTALAAGTGHGKGRCPEHGLVDADYRPRAVARAFLCDVDESAGQAELAEHSVRVARPDYDPRIDHPERYTDGPI